MRYLTHGFWRFTLSVWTLVPMYLGYLWLWIRKQKLGHDIPEEVWRKKHVKNAAKFVRLAVRLRGGMIKVGQLISARVDILPPEWTDGLSVLQDKVDPTPWAGIHKHLTAQYGKPPEDVFERIDEESIAAASFGQVHRAWTKDGRALALKIRYPDVLWQLKVDVFIAGIATPLFNVFIPKINLKTVHEEMKVALTTELDYAQEAEFTRVTHDNFADVPGVFIPAVHDEYSTDSVIATTFFEGYRIVDKAKLAELEVTPRAMLERILETWTKMMYEDGVFQSDPHPGNLLFNRVDGEFVLCVLDFGQTKVMPKGFHKKLIASVMAFIQRDVDAYALSVVNMGLLSAEDVEKAKPLIREFFEQYYDLSPAEAKELDLKRIRADVQALIKKIDGIHIPTDLVLYGRAFSLLGALGAALDDTLNLVEVAKPFLMKMLMASMAEPPEPAAAASVP